MPRRQIGKLLAATGIALHLILIGWALVDPRALGVHRLTLDSAAILLVISALTIAILLYAMFRNFARYDGSIGRLFLMFPDYLVFVLWVLIAALLGLTILGMNFDRWWLVILIPSGIGANLLSTSDATDQTDSDAEANDRPSNQEPSRFPFWFALLLITIIPMFGMLGAMGIGVFAFHLLRQILFLNVNVDLAAAGEASQRMIALLPLAFVIGGAVLAIYLIGEWVSGSIRRKNGVSKEEFNRPLLQVEIEYIKGAVDAVEEFRDGLTVSKTAKIVYWAGPWLILFAMFLVAAGSWLFTSAIHQLAYSSFLAETGAITDRLAFGGGSLIGIFTGIFVIWATYQFALNHFPLLRAYAYLEGRWNSTGPDARNRDDVEFAVTRFVLFRQLKTNVPFDVNEFFNRAHREIASIIYKATAALLGLTVILSVFDGLWFQSVSAEQIVWSGYFDLSRHETPLTEIDYVETACYIGQDDGEEKLRFRYALYNSDGIRFSLDDNFQRRHFDLIERIDERLTQASVEFQYQTGSDGDFRIDRRCLGFLDDRFGADSDRVGRLLRVSSD